MFAKSGKCQRSRNKYMKERFRCSAASIHDHRSATNFAFNLEKIIDLNLKMGGWWLGGFGEEREAERGPLHLKQESFTVMSRSVSSRPSGRQPAAEDTTKTLVMSLSNQQPLSLHGSIRRSAHTHLHQCLCVCRCVYAP